MNRLRASASRRSASVSSGQGVGFRDPAVTRVVQSALMAHRRYCPEPSEMEASVSIHSASDSGDLCRRFEVDLVEERRTPLPSVAVAAETALDTQAQTARSLGNHDRQFALER